ncbi:hypothetical protein GE09DRAFT_1210138 [Coniochaeta sp. 2T2.1]|nr:hypothetical protein GE09DRAFT_1210138 [Coniochaeta sp. 2T2.1]
MAASPASLTTKPSPGSTARIGRPPQWTVSRSRKLARLYVYTTLSIEKIIKVLEDDVFRPRKNSAQKTIHNMLDNDPRYLRPESRSEMEQRITSLSVSPHRRRELKRDKASPTPTAAFETVAEIKEEGTSRDPSLSVDDSDSVHQLKETIVQQPDLIFASELYTLPPGFTRYTPPMSVLPTNTPHSMADENSTYRGRHSTVFSGSVAPTTSSIRNLRGRVSGVSTRYARQISHLLKHFTISSASDTTQRPALSTRRPSISSTDDIPSETDVFEAFPEVGFALPGDFINVQNLSCAGFPGQDHFGGKCWCSIAEVVATEPTAWLLPTGELSARALHVLADPSQYNLVYRDCFGNAPLHLFAALESYQEPLFGMVLNSPDVRATNNAGQTFLHVLNIEWFSDLTSLSAPLKQLLAYLRDTDPDMVYVKDVYGRTFFHRAHSLIRDSEVLDGILSPFNPALSSRRDAFGFNPLANTHLGGEGPFIPPRRISLLTPLPEERPNSSKSRTTSRTSDEEDAFVAYHTRLLQIIHASYDNPRTEDEEGRNGLHCLAEVILNQQTMDEHRNAVSTGRSLKRKHDRHTPEGGPAEGPLASRLRHLQGLLRSNRPLDVNHYDKAGNTVLGAFITHIPDDQDDKAKSLSAILETLIQAGARIEGRNRRGETALLVAARLGRKIALTTLLERGANVHVRDVDGRGLLQVIDATCRAAREDVALYARLEACRVLLTGRRDWGVVREPGVLLEWRSKAVE